MARLYAELSGSECVQGKKLRCLIPTNHKNDDEQPSASIHDNRLTCHSQGCFKGDDIFSVIAKVKNIPNFKGQKAKIEEMFSLNRKGQGSGITATYDYLDEEGTLLYQTVRYQPKDFRQRRPRGTGGWIWDLKSTQVMAAQNVLICEGEKDCDAAYELGLPEGWACTTSPMGAKKWKPQYSEFLKGKAVTIIPDSDVVGRAHEKQIAEAVAGVGVKVNTLTLPENAHDLSAWVEAGGTGEAFRALLESAKPWEDEHVPERDGVRLRNFANITPESVHWTWAGRIPVRAVSLLVGEPDTGKTTIALTIAARISKGTLSGDWEGSPAHVVIASCEDSPSTTIRPRLEMAGADLSMIHFLTMKEDDIEGGISIPEDLADVEAAMLACGARFLIIDPVMGHLGDVDSYKDQNIRKALGPLAGLAESVDGAVLGIMHLNKRDCASITNRVGGSVGFVAAARSVLLAAQDPDQEEHGYGVLVHAKCNLAAHAPTIRYQLEGATYRHEEIEIQTSRVVWGEEAEHIRVSDVLQTPAKGGDEQGQRVEAREWICMYLEQGEKPATDILKEASKLGFSERTLRRVKKEIGIESSKGEFSGVWSWTLPEESQPPHEDCQTPPEGCHQQDAGSLRLNPYKKSNKSNDLTEGCQGPTGGNLRSGVGSLRASPEGTKTPQPGLFDQKETVMTKRPDGGFEEVMTDAD